MRYAYGYLCDESEFTDFTDKERLLDRFCVDHQIELQKIFIEEIDPATANDNDQLDIRKTLGKLIGQLPPKYIIVVPSANTFSANPYWRAILLHELRNRAIMVINAENGANLTKIQSQLDGELLKMLREFEDYRLRQKFAIVEWKSALNPHRAIPKSNAFGSQPGEDKTVAQVVQLWEQGCSAAKIMEWLNLHYKSYPPRNSARWKADQVEKLIYRETRGLKRRRITPAERKALYKRIF